MSAPPPLAYQWEGDVMRPLPRFARQADQQFVIGEKYVMEVMEERSMASHRHYFAALKDLWSSLPEGEASERFPTPEHLRKYALIRTGHRDELNFSASSKAEAVRIAAFIRALDDFAIVVVRDAMVTRYTAKSQSLKAMGREAFNASKDDVLAYLQDMIEGKGRD